MLRYYFKIAWRSIKKYRAYSIINISGLAIGMSCAILILFWIKYETSFDRFHNNSERIYRVNFENTRVHFSGQHIPGLTADYLRENYAEIDKVTSVGRTGVKIGFEKKGFSFTGYFVHPDFTEIFSFQFVKGNPEEPFATRLSVVISERVADMLFGDKDPLGESVILNDRTPAQVTAVIKNIPENSSLNFDFLLPFKVAPPYMRMWDNKAVEVYIRLNENVLPESVDEKIAGIYSEHAPNDAPHRLFLQPISEVHLNNLNGGGLIIYVYVFAAMGIVVLLIACINFMNLSTARFERRMKEISIKKIVGSTRLQLVKQFLSESVFLSVIALGFSIALVIIMLPLINGLFSKGITFKLTFDTILYLLGIVVFTGLVSGIYPSLYLSSFIPYNALKGKAGNGGAPLVRKVLVVGQFAITIIFIFSTLVIYKQLNFVRNTDLGFNKEEVLVVPVQRGMARKIEAFKAELIKHPDIENAAMSDFGIMQWGSSTGIGWIDDIYHKGDFDVLYNTVDSDYLDVYEMNLVDGRFFNKDLSSDFNSVSIVNEALVKATSMKDPVGKIVTKAPGTSFEQRTEIIGVIKDYHNLSLQNEIKPMMYYMAGGNRSGLMNIRINTSNIRGVLDHIGKTAEELVPGYSFDYRFIDEEFDRLYKDEMITGKAVIYIAYLAIMISSLGLLGLVSFSVEQKTKEIGIRKVLGASINTIVSMFIKDFIWLIVIANIISWPAAYFLGNKWLEKFAYHTDISITVYMSTGIIALVISLITIWIQTSKAAQSNPVESLRYE